jgi:hypothetical protein
MTRRGQRPGQAQGRERASRPLGRRLQARVFRDQRADPRRAQPAVRYAQRLRTAASTGPGSRTPSGTASASCAGACPSHDAAAELMDEKRLE